jgi:hypothetical protein
VTLMSAIGADRLLSLNPPNAMLFPQFIAKSFCRAGAKWVAKSFV